MFLAAFLAMAALEGVLDIHIHSGPDSTARSIDAIDLAKLAKERGMRGIVLKSHYEPTASMAYLARKAAPGLEVFGGIDLNRSVGGINPAAVERMTMMQGGYGRIVWMPTFDAENQVRFSKQDRPYVPVSRGGELLPEVKQVLALIAKHDLTLATGHSSAGEGLTLVREARKQGIARIIVTHAMLSPVKMTVPQMREAASMGAFIEFVYNGLVGASRELTIADYATAIRAIGPEHCVLASDLGQAANPLPPDGLARFLDEMRQAGFTAAEIDLMSKTNPALVLGLH